MAGTDILISRMSPCNPFNIWERTYKTFARTLLRAMVKSLSKWLRHSRDNQRCVEEFLET